MPNCWTEFVEGLDCKVCDSSCLSSIQRLGLSGNRDILSNVTKLLCFGKGNITYHFFLAWDKLHDPRFPWVVRLCLRLLIYNEPMGQFFCVGLGSMFYLLCLDSCLQTYVLRKIKTSRFMLCLSQNITWNETGICSFWAVWAVRAVGKNQVLTFASLLWSV